MKVERKYLAHFINTAPYMGEAAYTRLGTDLEEFSPEMSAQVEIKKNILGETTVQISGYEKSASVEPYYAVQDTELFRRLQSIIDYQLVMDDLKTDVVEVHLWEPEGMSKTVYTAFRDEAYIEITSYGGDTTGYQIPFTLHYTGVKVKGTFDIATKTFTAEEEA